MKYQIIAMLLAIMLIGCSDSEKGVITGSGVFEGTEVIVSSKTMGEITIFEKMEGDEIDRGEVLAQIDTTKLQIQKDELQAGIAEVDINIANVKEAIAQAKDNYENVKKKYNRIKALHENGSATQQQMDDIETQYNASKTAYVSTRNQLKAVEMKKKQLQAKLELLETQLADCSVTAPVSGVVVDKFVEQGEFVTIGMQLVSIVDLSELWIKLYVEETQLGFVKLGATAEIAIDSYPNKTFTGKVTWISPKAEFTPKNVQTKDARADLVYAVKIVVSNPDGIFKIGMPADISLKINQSK